MKKNKRWHFGLIFTVLAITLYNILPTLFYYCKPLHQPIDKKLGIEIQSQISKRIEDLQKDSIEWVKAYTKELSIKHRAINSRDDLIEVHFNTEEDAETFCRFFYKASSTISFAPAQLSILGAKPEEPKTIVLAQKLGISKKLSESLSFHEVKNNEQIAPDFIQYQMKKIQHVIEILTKSEKAEFLKKSLELKEESDKFAFLSPISDEVIKIQNALGQIPSALKRTLASFTQGSFENKLTAVKQATEGLEAFREKLKFEKTKILDEEKKLKEENKELSIAKSQQLELLKTKEENLLKSIVFFKKNQQTLASGKKEAQIATIESIIKQLAPSSNEQLTQTVSLQGLSPVIENISYDWNEGKFTFHPYSDLTKASEGNAFSDIDHFIMDEMAKISHKLNREVLPNAKNFVMQFNHINEPSAQINLNFNKIAEICLQQAKDRIESFWHPATQGIKDLSNSLLFISGLDEKDLNPTSLYIVMKNTLKSIKELSQSESKEDSEIYFQDIGDLQNLLYSMGFQPSHFSLNNEKITHDDFVFEAKNYYSSAIEATRENFVVSIDKRCAELQLSNLKQRLYTLNKIETAIHNELLQWKNDYFSAINHPHKESQPLIPRPAKNTHVSNLLLSIKKYFRGDERKVLKWGLDLSGGKSVEIAFVDHENTPVKAEKDIKLAINELYSRVNKLGVSEVSIRHEGDHVTVDFPGSQELSAKELIQASSMTFNVFNEKFSVYNPSIGENVNRFLQEVWNQSIMLNAKDSEQINAIARDLLYGDSQSSINAKPRTEAARVLLQNGLNLEKLSVLNGNVEATHSKIFPVKVDSRQQKASLAHPLVIVFAASALDGSSLSNIQSGFDPKEGNFLNFEVKKHAIQKDGSVINPQENLASWTEKYSKDAIKGSLLETFSNGHGHRMAVILNNVVVSAPTLNAAIKEGGRISGQFSQNDIHKLEADLKAGSLTFNPKILSEKNVSPDLGDMERFYGIIATAIALVLVVVTMTVYYRFAGFVASIAVILNLLIIWAILQNIQATITLAGLAGIVLTVGMAVDANVLVFERIKEELKIHNKLKAALESGYDKAFTAIIDSNLTTILAALVLLNFDSGPVKGFALTLIIGVITSMFTALFMTRFFFRFWVEKTHKKELKMMNWIKGSKINFLTWFKPAVSCVIAIILLGSYFSFGQKQSLLGMDFTGGYAINVPVTINQEKEYKQSVESALTRAGFSKQDFSVRELYPKNLLRIFLSKNIDSNAFLFPASSSKIASLEKILKEQGVSLSADSENEMQNSWTQVSGQMSDTMRNQALMGMFIALIGILLYISFRFEWKFAFASTIGLGVDLVLTLGLIAILNKLGVPLQIDLNTVAALLTIIGYSLNDTIIVFDRIREELTLNPHLAFKDLINRALNTTLSRTLLTSGTTLLVLVSLVVLGGPSIFSFSFVMALGVIIGTLSTFSIATPLLIYFEKKDRKEKMIISRIS